MANDTSGRSRLLGHNQLGAVPKGIPVHEGTRSTGGGPGAGTFVRSRVC